MTGNDGQRAGWAYSARSDGRSWIVVAVDYGVPSGRYSVEVVGADRSEVRTGDLEIRDGRGSWGGETGAVGDVLSVRLLDAGGRAVCEAAFSS
jgi:hypothetical protein